MPAPLAPEAVIPCPACHAPGGQVFDRVRSEEVARAHVLPEVDAARHAALRAAIEALWGGDTCARAACPACGFCFAWPFVAGDARFFALAFDHSSYPGWKWEFARTHAVLTELQAAGRLGAFRLLEIGAGDGAFAGRIAPALTPRDHVLCTEFSAPGLRALEALGLPTTAQDVHDLPVPPPAARFDVVAIFQALQGFDRLDALFAHLGALTNDRAHLFVSVPNHRRIAFNEANGSLLDLPPAHIGRWTEAAFKALAGRHGWEVAAYEVEPRRPEDALRHVLFRYAKMRQAPGSLAARLERVAKALPAGIPRRLVQGAGVLAYAPTTLPALAHLFTTPGLGDSQWVHLRKRGA